MKGKYEECVWIVFYQVLSKLHLPEPLSLFPQSYHTAKAPAEYEIQMKANQTCECDDGAKWDEKNKGKVMVKIN